MIATRAPDAMRLAVAAIMGSALLGHAYPASARVPQRITDTRPETTMARYVACLVEDRKPRARAMAFTRIVPSNENYKNFNNAGQALVNDGGGCLRNFMSIRFNAELFRLTLFSALYKVRFGGSEPKSMTGLPPTMFATEFDLTPGSVLPPKILAVRTIGDCVARGDPGGVHELLKHDINSPGEVGAIAAIRPAIAACLEADSKVAFSRSVLRGLLAEGLYKLRVASGEVVVP